MKQLDASADGVYLITVTPFTDSGALDLASTDRMVDFCLDKGVTGLTVLGIMGEATKLTAEESRLFVERVLARVAGRVPVVVGASAPGFAADERTHRQRDGAGRRRRDGGAAVQPCAPTIRSSPTSTWCSETLGPRVPWVLQDHPVATGVQMSAVGDPAHPEELPDLRDAQARRLARPGQAVDASGGQRTR